MVENVNETLIILFKPQPFAYTHCEKKQVNFIYSLGRNLVSSMSRQSSKDTLDTVKGIHKLLDSIELKQVFK